MSEAKRRAQHRLGRVQKEIAYGLLDGKVLIREVGLSVWGDRRDGRPEVYLKHFFAGEVDVANASVINLLKRKFLRAAPGQTMNGPRTRLTMDNPVTQVELVLTSAGKTLAKSARSKDRKKAGPEPAGESIAQ